jgi:antirestriction protein
MEQEPINNEKRHESDEGKWKPQIYVASLSDYNNGRLLGSWIDANQSPQELLSAVQAMLLTSPMPIAEEWGIFDHEGFGPLHIEEYEAFETISMLAKGISEFGEAFAHWIDLRGELDDDSLFVFEEAYLGCYESLEAYAETLIEDLGYLGMIQPSIPELLQPYVSIDIEGLARDLELSGDVMSAEGQQGVHVYDTRW